MFILYCIFNEKSRKNKYLPKAFLGDKIYPQNFNLANKKTIFTEQ